MRQSASLTLLSLLLLAPPPSILHIGMLFDNNDRQTASLSSATFVVHAFAEWTKCWTELEEGEIIMNQPVQRQFAADSDADNHENDGNAVRLLALDTNGRIVQPIHNEGKCNATRSPSQDVEEERAAADEKCNSKSNAVTPFTPGQTFHIKLMSASIPNKSDPSHLPPNTQYLAQTTEGGKFLGRSSMCDGSRAVGRKREEVVRIHLTGEQDVVKVWAGYASEKAAVILAPELVFRLDRSGGGDGRGGNAGGGASAPNPLPAPAPAPAPAPTPSVPSQPLTAPVMPPDL